jgi:ribosomal protein S18 acetylase RimI-like enzyme
MDIGSYAVRSYEESGVGFDELVAAFGRLDKLLPGDSVPPNRADVRAYTEKLVKFGFFDIVLAPDGEIVGLNAYYANDREQFTAHASVFILKPEVRGKAIILIRRALRTAKEQGMRTFRLQVLKSNTPAINIYERFGFTVCGESGEKLEMSKDLT